MKSLSDPIDTMTIKLVNYRNLPTSTAQEVFDHVALHLLKQAKPAISDEGFCTMVDDYGNRCAAGCLVTPEQWKELSQDPDAPSFSQGWPAWSSWLGVVLHHYTLIVDLQKIHDAAKLHTKKETTLKYWAKELRSLAGRYDFDTAVLDSNSP